MVSISVRRCDRPDRRQLDFHRTCHSSQRL